MNFNFSLVIWILLGVFSACGIYAVKYQVQAVKVEVANTERQLREEKMSLHVLAAEWTFLSRPSRIQQLASKYLDAKPVQGQQMADFANFPYKKSVDLADGSATSPHGAHLTLASGVANVR